MLKLILNKKYNPLFESDARYFIITGGRGSGKSFAAKVQEIENIQQDFIKSKYYECVKDKVPSVVIHAAKSRLGWNEKPQLDITSGGEKINMPVITFVDTETE